MAYLEGYGICDCYDGFSFRSSDTDAAPGGAHSDLAARRACESLREAWTQPEARPHRATTPPHRRPGHCQGTKIKDIV